MANLQKLVPAEIIFDPTGNQIEELDFVAGWGLKPGYKDARVFAEKYGIPYLGMEDGFLRSLGLGVEGAPALSFSLDDIGVYYDASRPSRLENILNSTGWENIKLLEESKKAIELIKDNYLSKYNTGRILSPSEFKQTGRKRVLVVDQTFGDMSISLGLADQQSFMSMYQKARQDNPDSDIYVKVHPDVIAGKKKGNIEIIEDERTFILSENSNPLSLIENMDKVYVVTSQMGFEALLLGKEVHCFGMPFYAGWGLTQDELTISRRNRNRTIEEIFAASYIMYCTYLNPETGKRGSIFDVITYILKNK
ncbi:capsular polysaccharide export protein, LipB/KpsS family [Bacillus sp. m3-13]|uniref:capsular polysaccharide export protein, LipB/KpsS family n=1 Tax=Bacillus sp. m3-13 TaxID=406124 RepID=UPI0001E89E39|nr:capsule polysaccharide biosynthesis [Bacillus sp. m3-13]